MNTQRALLGNGQHGWRCANAHVPIVNGARPFNGVANPDARGLGPGPEFEVLGTIVIAHAVDVVNSLPFDQVSRKQVLRDQNVFEDIGTSSGSRMSGSAHHPVARLVSGATALPVPVGLTDLANTGSARCGFDSFTPTAAATIPL